MNAHHPWILVSLHTNATNLKNMIDILPKIVKLEQATIPMFMCRTLMIKQRDSTWVKRHIFKSEKSFPRLMTRHVTCLFRGMAGEIQILQESRQKQLFVSYSNNFVVSTYLRSVFVV